MTFTFREKKEIINVKIYIGKVAYTSITASHLILKRQFRLCRLLRFTGTVSALMG